MSDTEDEQQQEDDQQSSDLPTSVYEVAEEQEEEGRGSKRKGGRGRRGRTATSTPIIGAAAASRSIQMTIADLDNHLDKQMKVIERMADDVKHLKKQFNQVQRDLAKFGKSMEKMKKKTTTAKTSKAKSGRRRG